MLWHPVHYQLSPPASSALNIMHRLSRDPGIVAVMNKVHELIGPGNCCGMLRCAKYDLVRCCADSTGGQFKS